ncbi:MAG TPA: DNA (cytosine-5-)-methyltransferase [Bryobacteraceae bacterium]|jgi:DNA (cytosine-5)-methyltransferase 1|nr:DNA (cytosine-5-)-methyltransferase [Bryobacteraceae bacterium]
MPRGLPLKPPSTLLLLSHAREFLTRQDLADHLAVHRRTIARWENGETECPAFLAAALRDIIRAHPQRNASGSFTFIDLFAGIGGMRAGFERAGGKCIFSSEWNPWAKRTYIENFGFEEDRFVGDIVPVETEDIPEHDVLLAGFPCQPFSIAGVSKKNALGRPHGFECATQGTLFFDVARIISEKRPKAFLLENVKNLLSHDGGNTFRVIRQTLQKELGYDVHHKVIDGGRFVPQHRERILIAGFREPVGFDFEQIQIPAHGPRLDAILHPEDGSEPAGEPYTTGARAKVHSKYVLTDKLWGYLQAYAEKHRKAGNGFGFGLVDRNSVARTLSARYYKDGSEILVSRGKGRNPRRLTPRECARLMGFPDSFRIPVSDTQAYKQFGNSVVVPVIEAVAQLMEPYIRTLKRYEETGVLELPLFALAP